MLSPPSHPNLQQRIKASARRWSKDNNKLIIDKWQSTIIFLHLKRNAKKIFTPTPKNKQHPPQQSPRFSRNRRRRTLKALEILSFRTTLRNHKNHFDIRHSMLSSQTAWWQPWNEVLHYEPHPMFPPWQNSLYPLAERFVKEGFCQGYTHWQRVCYVYRQRAIFGYQSPL